MKVRHATSRVRFVPQIGMNRKIRERFGFSDGSGKPSDCSGEPSSQQNASGFTLLEVLVALTVFAVAGAVILSLISGSLGNIRKVQLRTRTVEHAEAVMELTLLDESVQGPTSFSGDFEDGTRWTVVVEEYVPPEVTDQPADGRLAAMPVKLLSYTIEMFSPNSTKSDYRLQTLKLVRATREDNLTRMP